MLDDDELLGDDGAHDGLGAGPQPAKRRFWIVTVAIGTVSAVTLVGILANRPLVGSIAHAETELRGALAQAQEAFAQSGTFSSADAQTLATADPSTTYLPGDTEATQEGQVSVYATATRWGAAVAARPHACFYIARSADGPVRYGSGTTCTGQAALAASDQSW